MKIILEPFVENDISKLITWIDKPGASDLWASRTYPYPVTHKKVEEHLKKTQLFPTELSVFKIVSVEKNLTVGHVELDKFDHHSRSVRITRLFIDPKYRKLGLARQATELLIKHCFENLELNRVEIFAIETNHVALQLYEKIGFKREGFLRENMYLSGEKFGSHVLSMLRGEFLSLSN